MKINRNNYEEFFILYLDKELGEEDRIAVESFVEQNPDLREELELLSQFRLQPDEEICFPDKSSLLKNGELSAEKMLLYLDGELTPEEHLKVELAINTNETLRQEFNILKKTKLEDEQFRFPDKSILYRHTEAARLIPIRWKRIAAAVVILLLAGTVYLLLNDRDQADKTTEIANSGKTQTPKSDAPAKGTLRSQNEVKETAPQLAHTGNDKNQVLPLKEDRAEDFTVQTPKTVEIPLPRFDNDLPEETRPAIASVEPIEKARKDPEYDFSNTSVTTLSAQPSNIHIASYPSDNISEEDQEPGSGKKNKLRGLFRKVTRTFEKRTNIDATDEDGKLLVAGLAIKL